MTRILHGQTAASDPSPGALWLTRSHRSPWWSTGLESLSEQTVFPRTQLLEPTLVCKFVYRFLFFVRSNMFMLLLAN